LRQSTYKQEGVFLLTAKKIPPRVISLRQPAQNFHQDFAALEEPFQLDLRYGDTVKGSMLQNSVSAEKLFRINFGHLSTQTTTDINLFEHYGQ
jgi:hypothetical protein